jgi:hypothetical protein
MNNMEDTDWRPAPEPKLEPITLYELREWDGADGRSNSPTGFVTKSAVVANEWSESGTGRDFRTMEGVIIERMSDIGPAKVEREKQKALGKLTAREKELLGL